MAKTKSITQRITEAIPGKSVAQTPVERAASAVGGIKDRVLGGGEDRSTAAKKAAVTRKRNAAKRSQAAKRGAKTRAKPKSKR